MRHLSNAVRQAVGQRNWYGALSVALTLPDICARIEEPPTNRSRYVDWCDRYLTPRYTHFVGGQSHTFLTGTDCYALRCAVLHEGRDDIASQRARKALEKFTFIEPPSSGSIHMNQINQHLQLQVDLFCLDICSSVEQWLGDLAKKPDEAFGARLSELMKIQSVGDQGFTL